MHNRGRGWLSILWHAYLSIVISTAVLVGSHLIPSVSQMYSESQPIRWQTEALLHGHVAVAQDATGIAWDLAYANGKVQQVWGLGVPFWRLPFEALARLFGERAFPDRLCFGIALACITFILLRPLPIDLSRPGQDTGIAQWLVLFVTVLFPPFLNLCSSEFLDYEEVEAYGFLVGILLMILLTRFFFRPSPQGFLVLALISGLVPYVRPTLVFYGTASVLLAAIILWRRGHRIGLVGVGFALFSSLIGVLLWSNKIRFGAALEWGHSLNFNGLAAMRFASRFDDPFRREPLISAATELISLLFVGKVQWSTTGYESHMFPGQSSSFRWRHLYFSTFDFTVLFILLVVWIWGGRRLWRLCTGKKQTGYSVLEPIVCWSLLSAIPLGMLYLRFPFMASRYLLDFGPSFAAAIWVFWCLIRQWMNKLSAKGKNMDRIVAVTLLVWWAYEAATIHGAGGSNTWTHSRVVDTLQPSFGSKSKLGELPPAYTNGFPFETLHINFNGADWDPDTGATKACIPLFVENPECVILEVMPADGAQVSPKDYDCIQAKIGLEFLERQSINPLPRGTRIVFRGPQKRQYQTGIQPLFVAMMPVKELNAGYSKFRLLKVVWHRETHSQR